MGCMNTSTVDNGHSYFQLLSGIQVGAYKLRNKLIMGAMTRCKADPKDGIPNDLHVKYYTQRGEDAGLVLTECVPIRQDGEGFPGAAQLFNKEQANGWKKVTDSVHKVGGRIFAQLYHAGRATCSEKIGGKQVVGASDIQNRYSSESTKYDVPVALSTKEVEQLVQDFVNSAKLAKEAGFDGVEIHGGAGYLVDQFLKDATNNRTDKYGGSVENRCRFLLEIIDGVSKVFGYDKIGAKITPGGRFNDMYDSDPVALLATLLPEINKRKIAFIEIARPSDGTPRTQVLYDKMGEEQLPNVYDLFGGLKSKLSNVVLIGNQDFTPEEAETFIRQRKIDAISFAKNYIGNPDLSKRLRNNWPLTAPDFANLYAQGEKGYSDYPVYVAKQ